jgi:hypothetical protein
MEEQSIHPYELVLLVVWLSSPALIIGAIVLVGFRLRLALRSPVALVLIGAYLAATVVLTSLLWLVTPTALLPSSLIRGVGPLRIFPQFFVPAYVAGTVALTITWSVARKLPNKPLQPITRENARSG